ncbi:MAG: hypothetical protein WBA74_05000 [Cyclobacteriaceae bacterium]
MVSEVTTPIGERRAALTEWVVRAQPQMQVFRKDEDVFAHGRYDLRPELPGHPPGAILTSYDLRIVVPPDVERVGPRVYETGNKIPRSPERHVGDDGWCCTGVFPVWRATARDPRYIAFLDDPLRNFFIGQVAVDEGLEWPFGEYRHGSDGVIEAAAGLLGSEATAKAVRETLRLLPVLRERGDSISYRTCPCGSKRVLKQCCFGRLHALSLSHDPQIIEAIAQEVGRQMRKAKGIKPIGKEAA